MPIYYLYVLGEVARVGKLIFIEPWNPNVFIYCNCILCHICCCLIENKRYAFFFLINSHILYSHLVETT